MTEIVFIYRISSFYNSIGDKMWLVEYYFLKAG